MISSFPTGQSGSHPAELRLNALSSATAGYLSEQVGQIISARVVNVVSELTSSVQQSLKPGDTGKTTNEQQSGPFRVELKVEIKGQSRAEQQASDQRLVVSSPLAPRKGQVLQLKVLDARHLEILAASLRAGISTIGNVPADRVVATGRETSQAIGHSAGGDRTTATANVVAGTSSLSAATPAATVPARSAAADKLSGAGVVQQALANLRRELPRSAPAENINANLQFASNIGRSLQRVFTTVSSHQTGLESNNTQLLQSILNAIAGQSRTQAVSPHTESSHNPGASSPARSNTVSSSRNETSFQGLQSSQLISQLRSLTNTLQATTSALPDFSQLATAAGIQQAIQNSGVFYERKIAAQIHTAQTFEKTATRQRDTTATREPNPARDRQLGAQILASPEVNRDSKHNQLAIARHAYQALQMLLGRPASPQAPEVATLWDAIPQQLDAAASNTTTNPAANPGNQGVIGELIEVLVLLLKQSLAQSARTQSQQLLAMGSQLASADGQSAQSLSITLPFLLAGQAQSLHLQIEREPSRTAANNREPKGWTVRLRFSLDELGELTALASLRGKAINAVFWSETSQLAEKLEAELAGLNSTLTASGLAVNHLLCRVGVIELDDTQSAAQLLADTLLNAQV